LHERVDLREDVRDVVFEVGLLLGFVLWVCLEVVQPRYYDEFDDVLQGLKKL
jgi:hypothetical protein